MLVQLIFWIILFLVYNFYWKRRNLPPGPTPWPLFGNSWVLCSKTPPYHAFAKWKQTYGPIFTYWIGEMPVVALTDYKLIKQTFLRDADSYTGRDFLNAGYEVLKEFSEGIHGVVRTEGEEWRYLRRFSIHTLKNLGVGRSQMENKIMEEVNILINTIKTEISNNQEEHDIIQLIEVAVGSVITQIMFGYAFHGDDRKEFYRLKKLMTEELFLQSSIFCKMSLTMPFLRHFPFFSTAFHKFDTIISEQFGFFDRQINNQILKREKQKNHLAENFVDAFLIEQEQNKKLDKNDMTSQRAYFSKASLRSLCYELYGAGQETTSNSLNFIILYIMLNKNVQIKLQAELDEIIGSNRIVLMSDQANLPYTQAVIKECQRMCNLLPQNLPHKTTKTVEISGYKIEEGTVIVPQISSVLYDEKIFPDPQTFLPERFLDANGELKKCEEFIPFSIGKRQCLGEALAKMELFLFTANIFKQFEIDVLDPKNLPSIEKINGLTVSTKPYKCKIQKRI